MKKFKFLKKEGLQKLPKKTGVYCFSDKRGKKLYIGKATYIQDRVKNHFPSRSEGERRSQKQVSSLVSPSALRTNVLRTPKRQRRGEKKIYLLRTQQPGFKDYLFLDKVKKVGYIKTGSEIEALILEAHLIKEYQPKYNVIWRDNKNYFYVGISKEDFPRIFITHQLKIENCKLKIDYVGPFVDGKALKKTLKILRKIFPYRTCKTLPKRPCLWYQLGRCPAPCCVGTVGLLRSPKYPPPNFGGGPTRQAKLATQIPGFREKMKNECKGNTKHILKILQGKKTQVLKKLKKEMKEVAKSQKFEKAAKIRDQIFALEKILAHAKIFEPKLEYRKWETIEKELKRLLKTKRGISRIEAYDVSNIQGRLATGAMITFVKGLPDKNFYRKFKIKISGKPNDIAMLKEILSRRVKHPEWGKPDLILIDGGRAQLNVAISCLTSGFKHIEVMAIVKRKNELYTKNKRLILLKNLPREIFNLILQLSDEAHRFALTYHKKLREKELVG